MMPLILLTNYSHACRMVDCGNGLNLLHRGSTANQSVKKVLARRSYGRHDIIQNNYWMDIIDR
jgi:hypothetical protein